MTLQELNALDQTGFVARLGGIFEHTPWLARDVWPQRPFASVAHLHERMCALLAQAPLDARLALIRAHPELAGKAAIRNELTAESRSEQGGAGLDQCSAEEYAELQQLNERYHEKFGFPFILAVRGHNRQSIIANFRSRVDHDRDTEIAECLRQIERIALLRLETLLLA